MDHCLLNMATEIACDVSNLITESYYYLHYYMVYWSLLPLGSDYYVYGEIGSLGLHFADWTILHELSPISQEPHS